MSQITETICDQCGARKGKTNYWFSLFTDVAKNGFHLYRDINQTDKRKDICSMMCATKALQEFMSPKQDALLINEEVEEVTK